MKSGRRNSAVALAAAVAVLTTALCAEEEWKEKDRDKARKAAEEAVERWNPSQQFTFKVCDEVFRRTCRPQHSPLYMFYPEHYGRRNVLQLHPFSRELPGGIETTIRVPPSAADLRFVVSGHEREGVDVGWSVKINGKEVFSETIKTKGKWKDITVPVKEYAGQEVKMQIDVSATGWNFEFLFLDRVGFVGDRLSADTGRIRVLCEQFAWPVAAVEIADLCLGTLECAVAQFEKPGLGYKHTGIGQAEATDVKAIKVVKSAPDGCVVEVTTERTESEETKRRFEAVYRLTMVAGQNSFESRLISIKNTDNVAYEVRGYCHRLRPADSIAEPVGFQDCAGSILGTAFLGGAALRPGDFDFAMRSRQAGGYGDIIRKVSARIEPGFTWEGRDEPAVLIFAGKGDSGQALFKAAQQARAAAASPKPVGTMKY